MSAFKKAPTLRGCDGLSIMKARSIKNHAVAGSLPYTSSAIECGCIMSRHFALSFSLAALICCTSAVCARAIEPMLTAPIDESQRVTLPGNTTPAALDGANDRGSVDGNLRLEHLLLVLKGSPDSEAALRLLIDEQHNPAAVDQYHHWLTPQQIGERFGLAPVDLDALRS